MKTPASYLIPTLSLLALAVTAVPANATELLMPFRGDSLPSQTVFSTGGHSGYNCDANTPSSQRNCALDISARRWNETTQNWTSAPWPGGGSSNPETNTVTFGAALYAPVDGEIVACWREMPDDDVSGDSIRCPGGGEFSGHQCARRGNHVVILTDEGEVVDLNHLQESSIPDALCPHSAQFLYTDDSVSCGFYDDARLANPIPIQRGDFVGRIGSTGASTGPHLHMQMAEASISSAQTVCRGEQVHMEFSESWWAPLGNDLLDADDWSPLDVADLPVDGTRRALWPDPIGPRTDMVTLETGSMPAIAATSNGGVLAFRDGSGNLSTVAYGPDSNGLLELGAEDGAGGVSDIAMAKIGSSSRHVVVGVRNGSGRMQLIPYYVSNSHALTRGGSLVFGRSSAVALTRAPNHQGVVSARINAAGSVTVTDISVAVSGTTLTPTARGSDSANAAARAVAVDRVVAGRGLGETSGRFRGVVTAERRSDDRLAVRSWSVTSQGVVQREDAYLASFQGAPVYVEDVDISVVGDGQREVAVVSGRERGSDHLLVFTIEISSTGDLDRVGGYEAGSVGEFASATAGAGDVLLGVASAAGTLIEMAFGVRSDAGTGDVRRTGTQRLETVGELAVAVRAGQGEAVFALQDGSGELQLARHRLNVSDSL